MKKPRAGGKKNPDKVKQRLDRKKVDAICEKVRALPVHDSRTPDEILGYDEYGVPR
jgi:antitoxin VapB